MGYLQIVLSASHLPAHSSREILIIFGSLTTCDPGNVHDTVEACVRDRIQVNVVALAAEMKICRDFCTKTGGGSNSSLTTFSTFNYHTKGHFGVALNEGHFKDLMFESIPPPAQRAIPVSLQPPSGGIASSSGASAGSDLLIMGFPTQIPASSSPSLCACHAELKRQGYICPRCSAKLCDVPTDCDICGLMIVSSPHLARSYHHLFPVQPFQPQCVAPTSLECRSQLTVSLVVSQNCCGRGCLSYMRCLFQAFCGTAADFWLLRAAGYQSPRQIPMSGSL